MSYHSIYLQTKLYSVYRQIWQGRSWNWQHQVFHKHSDWYSFQKVPKQPNRGVHSNAGRQRMRSFSPLQIVWWNSILSRAAKSSWASLSSSGDRQKTKKRPAQPSKEFVRNRGNLFLAQSIKEGGLSDEDLANQRLNEIISPCRFVWVTLRACDWTKRQGPWVKRYK